MREIVRGHIDWPVDNSLFVIEDNPGDAEPIHIHMGYGPAGWAFRLHFTYDEFEEFSKQILSQGKL